MRKTDCVDGRLRLMMGDQKPGVIGLLVGSEQQGKLAVGDDIANVTSDDAGRAVRW